MKLKPLMKGPLGKFITNRPLIERFRPEDIRISKYERD
jgi:hypothetical protein